jgi:DNA-binding NarL/FixJ family response regulator
VAPDLSDDISVLVVDDQRVVRDGLAAMIDLIAGLRVVGTAADGAQAVEQARALHPDVVLMDLRMPNVGGVEATRAITSDHLAGAVVILTTYTDDESITGALAAGASGYLTKDADAEVIASGIRAVHGGAMLLDRAVGGRVLAALPATPGGGEPDPTLRLTDREMQVLRLIAGGRSNQEISADLHVGVATVKTHVNSLFAKLGVRDRAQAVAYAYRHGIVTTPPPRG